MTKPIEIRTWDELLAAFRQAALSIDATLTSLDVLAGLPEGYLQKILGPVPVKNFGRISFGPALAVLGRKLVMVVDEEAIAKLGPRTPKRRYVRHAHVMMPTNKRRRKSAFLRNSQWGKVMVARRTLMRSPEERSASARRAAKARWAKARSRRRAARTASSAAAPADPRVEHAVQCVVAPVGD